MYVRPCLPSPAERPPSGSGWLHEIKLDGFRMLARRDAAGVRLLTRNAFDWAGRYPGITSAVNGLRCRSCLIDGEVVICGEDGIPIFNRLREGKQVKGEALLFAFDLIELDGRDLRREPIEARKATLAKLLRKAAVSLQLNEHIIEPGDLVFKHACRMGLEGIVSKRLGSTYRSGRSNHWLKMKTRMHRRCDGKPKKTGMERVGDDRQEQDHDLRPQGGRNLRGRVQDFRG
jgi:bifunctional non-homologous end joining protein LigD